MKYQGQSLVIQMSNGPRTVMAHVAKGTGLAYHFLEDNPTKGYILTHVNSGYALSSYTVDNESIAQRWLELVLPLETWTMDARTLPLRIHQGLIDRINAAFDQAIDEWNGREQARAEKQKCIQLSQGSDAEGDGIFISTEIGPIGVVLTQDGLALQPNTSSDRLKLSPLHAYELMACLYDQRDILYALTHPQLEPEELSEREQAQREHTCHVPGCHAILVDDEVCDHCHTRYCSTHLTVCQSDTYGKPYQSLCVICLAQLNTRR